MSLRNRLKKVHKSARRFLHARVAVPLREKRTQRRFERLYLAQDLRAAPGPAMKPLMPWPELPVAGEAEAFLCRMYAQHRFDYLGSGFVPSHYGARAVGVEGHRYGPFPLAGEPDPAGQWLAEVVHPNHLTVSRKIWAEIRRLDPGYRPIDWQLDGKSGFRWDARQLFRLATGVARTAPGADIIVPWERSRLQHLPRLLAWSPDRRAAVLESQCQMLDFMMANPIGMGVNFSCAMDVALRNASMLLAWDLMKHLAPQEVGPGFESLLARYLLESAEHIKRDIEYWGGRTNNHYVADVLGILYTGAYLQEPRLCPAYVAFGAQELRRCMERDFFPDGSCFEGSACYHRLTGEMMVWGAGLLLACPEDTLRAAAAANPRGWQCVAPLRQPDFAWLADPADLFWTRLARGGQFSLDLTKPNAEVAQFGDDDSGRFASITPLGLMRPTAQLRERYLQWAGEIDLPEEPALFDEAMLNHGAYVSAVRGLLGQPEQDIPAGLLCRFEFTLFRRLGARLPRGAHGVPERARSVLPPVPRVDLAYEKTTSFAVEDPSQLDGLRPVLYPDFQVAILRNDRMFVALAGLANPDQYHRLGHSHNDKASVELHVDGRDVLSDPGTYLYTPVPERRRQFRDVDAHNTIRVEGCVQNPPRSSRNDRWDGLFWLDRRCRVLGLSASGRTLSVVVACEDLVHHREVEVTEEAIVVRDRCNKPFEQRFNPLPWVSKGYGRLERRESTASASAARPVQPVPTHDPVPPRRACA